MGIPSYFSHITKRHSKVIKDVKQMLKLHHIDHLFLDANSIIYDACKTTHTNETIYIRISEIIICYIELFRPSGDIFVAFDGVAPMAKMSQQRTRRCKGSIEKKYSFEPPKWDTTSITPGTMFMNELPDKLRELLPENIIISGPDEPGEGEHKIFDYIRNRNMKNDVCAIYGLDADLIMLSMLNLPSCSNIYLARETPYFYSKVENKNNEILCMDVSMLASHLCDDLKDGKYEISDETYISDYIFICFLLGNDFLPHFPSINIRHNGIDTIIIAYKKMLSVHKSGLTCNNDIKWRNVRTMMKELSKDEYERLLDHYVHVDNLTKRTHKSNKIVDRLNNIPLYDRRDEEGIDPHRDGWEQRYYSILFRIYPDNKRISEISRNYIEGLEWTFIYYKSGCIDWRWCYNYNYPPLLNDLLNHIPYFNGDILEKKEKNPVHPLAQLSYVLPSVSFGLLPVKIKDMLEKQYCVLCDDNYDIQWAFCRYFWESNIVKPEIDINKLERDILVFK
jgi:5'-3' exonuclease